MAGDGIPLDKWSGAGATKELHKTMKDFVETSGEQAKTMIKLTRAITGLTVVMLLAVIIQIILMLSA